MEHFRIGVQNERRVRKLEKRYSLEFDQNPKNPSVLEQLGECQKSRRDFSNSLKTFESLPETFPNYCILGSPECIRDPDAAITCGKSEVVVATVSTLQR